MRSTTDDPTQAGVKTYLEYLDKEMTIMGILTAFAGGVPSFVLDRTIGSKDATPAMAIWTSYSPLVLLGSAALFLSALYFYRQRSELAYYVGQISLCLTPADYKDKTVAKWITEADLWSTWDHYATAFAFVAIGFVYYGMALILTRGPNVVELTRYHLYGPTVVILLGLLIHRAVFHKYKDEYRPWRAFWLGVRERRGARSG